MATAKTNLYLTADRTTVVGEGDARAAFLFAGAGTEIDESDQELFKQSQKLGKGGGDTTTFEVVDAKAVPAPPEDKAVKNAATKAKE